MTYCSFFQSHNFALDIARAQSMASLLLSMRNLILINSMKHSIVYRCDMVGFGLLAASSQALTMTRLHPRPAYHVYLQIFGDIRRGGRAHLCARRFRARPHAHSSRRCGRRGGRARERGPARARPRVRGPRYRCSRRDWLSLLPSLLWPFAGAGAAAGGGGGGADRGGDGTGSGCVGRGWLYPPPSAAVVRAAGCLGCSGRPRQF